MSITMTTTHSIETREIIEYKGIVMGTMVHQMEDLGSIEEALNKKHKALTEQQAKYLVLRDMENQAFDLGANAIVGVLIQINAITSSGHTIGVSIYGTGTAVVVK